MNNSYQRLMRRSIRSYRQLLLLLLLLLPGLIRAQNFTETFGTTANGIQAFETLSAAQARNAFDNSATLAFAGNVLGSPNGGRSTNQYTYTNGAGASVGGSGGGSIIFARENPNTAGTAQSQQGVTYTLTISNINTTALNSRQRISFGLRVPTGAVDGDLVLEARDGNTASSFTAIPFTFPAAPATGNEWSLITTVASLPSTTNLILQVRKPAGISNRQFRLDDLTVRGFVPALTASIDSQIFPNTPVNQRSAAQVLTVAGTDLTTSATVTAPTGYLVRLTGVGTYAQSVAITPDANGSVSATVEVIFAPTFASAPGPYAQAVGGSLTVSSTGATTRSITVTGQATAPQPVLTANPTSLAFGSQTVGTSSGSQPFQLIGQDLTGNVTVTAPSGFEIRVGSTAFSPNPLVLATNGGSLNVQVDVRFVPGTTGTVVGNLVATGNGSAQATVTVSGTGATAPTTPTINASPTTLDFQTVTNSGSAQNQTFTISATNLSNPLTLTPSNANIEIRNATAGGSFSSAAFTINPNPSGNITNQTIEVRLVPTVLQGPFTGTVALTSTGATQVDVTVTANNPSGGISDISLTNAILREFSTSPGTPSGIQSYNVSADNLLQDLTILAPQFFQISLTNNLAAPGGFNSLGTTTGNSLVLPRVTGSATPSQNGDIDLTTVYVRYYPPAAQTNRGQVVSNSSAPARTQFVSVNGSSEPEVNVRGTFAPVVNQVKGTQSAAQALVIVGARLNSDVTVRVPQDPEPGTTASPLNPDRTPQFQISRFANFSDLGSSTNPTGFLLTLTPDANDSIPRVPIYVRYTPTRVGSALADLLFRTPDLGGNVEFTRVPNARLQGRSIDVEPTRQSAATLIRSADRTSVTIVFTQENGSTFPGNPEAAGFGENRLIVASLNNTLTPGFFPQDATPYDPGNNVYGQGNNINGNFVVFASSATSAVITGLDPNTNYFFFGFEYNNDQVGGAENYKTPNLPITVQLPLPVELVSFTAQLRNAKVNLNWATASEKDNRGFEVQRSQNAQQFTTVLFKAGRGSTSARTNYEAVDERPLSGLSYYRLKQIDLDGKFTYSPVVIVRNAGLTEASFYPNPTSGKLTISLPQAQGAALQVRITDLAGRLVRTQLLPATGEINLDELRAGTYLVTVGAGELQVTRKVVKN